MRILLIEDDKALAQSLKRQLENHFLVELAFTGEEGEYQASINTYDVIILDFLLPGDNGLEICKKLRENGIHTPVLVLTSAGEITNKVELLNWGADDYLTKPFHMEELIARIRALLRRPHQTLHSNVIAIGDLHIDLDKQEVTRDGKVIHLPRKQFYLLEYLARNVGRVITREMILDRVWESTDESMSNSIEVHIKNIRARIDRNFDKKLIKTVRGVGYKIEA